MILSSDDALFGTAKRVFVDANVVIAYFDKRHVFHKHVHSRLNPIYLEGADFFFVQPCLLELKEYWRRKMLSETIELQLQTDYRLYSKFEKAFVDFQSENKKRNQLYLTDFQIKALRELLENVAAGKGLKYWLMLCNQALKGKLAELERTLTSSNFIYAKFNDGNVFPIELQQQWPKWAEADLLQEKYGLASNDAAILNMMNGAQNIDAFVSNDGDMLFAVASGALKDSISTYTFLDSSPYQS